MAFWLMKTEPDEFSIDDLKNLSDTPEPWNGIRNYQARNIMRDQIKNGDLAFIYHSSCKEVGVAGIARVVKEAYTDPEQFNPDSKYHDAKAQPDKPRWYCVDVVFVEKFDKVVLLKAIKAHPELAEMVLVKQGRLSVQPVEKNEWAVIKHLAGAMT